MSTLLGPSGGCSNPGWFNSKSKVRGKDDIEYTVLMTWSGEF